MPVDEVNETWADASDVLLYTGETVDEATVIRAQDIIDLFTGTTFAAFPNLTGRNLRHLNRAVAYQAGWMNHHPDLYAHLDMANVNQDGANFTPQHDNAALLAPFAKRWLSRLTWMNKPLRVRLRYGTYTDDDHFPRDSAAADDARYWTPM